ncbi:unnamed protein product [Mytilus coruscus]|uniref:Uncharacterized protein n=1 Tax=Mytilus coruscus TaxID=42192 RepID=A0A6J8C3I9_MYTCO|nr:unnamed protein product [Mytilus coruscus]
MRLKLEVSFDNEITDPVKDGLKSSIQSEYQGFNGTNFESIAWNFINQKFACCGVESYQDFTSATDWLYNYTGKGIILVTPLSCCQSLPTSDNFTCAESLSSTVNNYNTGCFNKLWDIVIGNPAITAPVISLCLLMQTLFLATTIVLLKKKSHKKRKIRPGNSDIAWAS